MEQIGSHGNKSVEAKLYNGIVAHIWDFPNSAISMILSQNVLLWIFIIIALCCWLVNDLEQKPSISSVISKMLKETFEMHFIIYNFIMKG